MYSQGIYDKRAHREVKKLKKLSSVISNSRKMLIEKKHRKYS